MHELLTSFYYKLVGNDIYCVPSNGHSITTTSGTYTSEFNINGLSGEKFSTKAGAAYPILAPRTDKNICEYMLLSEPEVNIENIAYFSPIWQTSLEIDSSENIISTIDIIENYTEKVQKTGITLLYKITETEPTLIVGDSYQLESSEDLVYFYGVKYYNDNGEWKYYDSLIYRFDRELVDKTKQITSTQIDAFTNKLTLSDININFSQVNLFYINPVDSYNYCKIVIDRIDQTNSTFYTHSTIPSATSIIINLKRNIRNLNSEPIIQFSRKTNGWVISARRYTYRVSNYIPIKVLPSEYLNVSFSQGANEPIILNGSNIIVTKSNAKAKLSIKKSAERLVGLVDIAVVDMNNGLIERIPIISDMLTTPYEYSIPEDYNGTIRFCFVDTPNQKEFSVEYKTNQVSSMHDKFNYIATLENYGNDVFYITSSTTPSGFSYEYSFSDTYASPAENLDIAVLDRCIYVSFSDGKPSTGKIVSVEFLDKGFNKLEVSGLTNPISTDITNTKSVLVLSATNDLDLVFDSSMKKSGSLEYIRDSILFYQSDYLNSTTDTSLQCRYVKINIGIYDNGEVKESIINETIDLEICTKNKILNTGKLLLEKNGSFNRLRSSNIKAHYDFYSLFENQVLKNKVYHKQEAVLTNLKIYSKDNYTYECIGNQTFNQNGTLSIQNSFLNTDLNNLYIIPFKIDNISTSEFYEFTLFDKINFIFNGETQNGIKFKVSKVTDDNTSQLYKIDLYNIFLGYSLLQNQNFVVYMKSEGSVLNFGFLKDNSTLLTQSATLVTTEDLPTITKINLLNISMTYGGLCYGVYIYKWNLSNTELKLLLQDQKYYNESSDYTELHLPQLIEKGETTYYDVENQLLTTPQGDIFVNGILARKYITFDDFEIININDFTKIPSMAEQYRYFYGKFTRNYLNYRYNNFLPIAQKFAFKQMDKGTTNFHKYRYKTNELIHPIKEEYLSSISINEKENNPMIFLQEKSTNHLAIGLSTGSYNGLGSGLDYRELGNCTDSLIGLIHLKPEDSISEALLEQYQDLKSKASVYNKEAPDISDESLWIYGTEIVEITPASTSLDFEIIANTYGLASLFDTRFYTMTTFSINKNNKRASHFYSMPEIHSLIEPIRAVVDVSHLYSSFSFSKQIINPDSNPYAPTSSPSTIELIDDIFNWTRYNPKRKYQQKIGDAVYYYDGTKSVLNCEYVGYIENITTEMDSEKTIINCIDRMSNLQEKTVDEMVYLDQSKFSNLIQQTIGRYIPCQVILSKQTRDYIRPEELPYFPVWYAGHYKTYKEIFEILGNMGVRSWFDKLDRLILDFEAIEKENIEESHFININSYDHIEEKSFKIIEKENLRYNKIELNHTTLTPKLNPADFVYQNTVYGLTDFNRTENGGIINGISHKMIEKTENPNTIYIDGTKEQSYRFRLLTHEISINDFNKLRVVINGLVVLVDNELGIQFNCKVVDALLMNGKIQLSLAPGSDYNYKQYHFGYFAYLDSIGFSDTRVFTMYTTNILPIMYSLETAIPLIPQKAHTILIKTDDMHLQSTYYGKFKEFRQEFFSEKWK